MLPRALSSGPMPIDVVVNRNARWLGDGTRLRETIERVSHREGARVHVTTDVAELETLANTIAREGTDGVVLAGGDGSTMAGVSALGRAFRGQLPPVGLAPGGTVGTIARNFGIASGAPRAWAERLVRSACTGKVRIERKATLRLQVEHDGTSAALPPRGPHQIERVGFIFGAGLVARFFDEYYAAPEPSLPVAARIAARVFAGSFVGSPLARRVLSKAECTVEVDGVPQENRGWSLILASVVRDVGLHVLATYRAGKSLDRFHVVASGLSAHALGLQVPRVLLGRPMAGDARVDALAASLRVAFDEPTAFVLDGELLRAQVAQVTAGPVLPLMLPSA
jgi:diacylglycerol kinase (ATP)